MEQLIKAFSVASIAHKTQQRKGDNGAPYINHLIEVAYLLSDIAKINEPTILIAAILHDILEDTEITKEMLQEEFGKEAVSLVMALTDDKTLPLQTRREAQLKHISMASRDVKLIKLADHCSNVANIPPSWDKTRVLDYLAWSKQVASQCFAASEELAKVYIKRYDSSLSKAELS